MKTRLISIVGGIGDTRLNNEDFAITPYLFGVWAVNGKIIGFGLCWGWWSACIGLGFNLPIGYKRFLNLTKNA